MLSIGEALPGRDVPGMQVCNEMLADTVARFRKETALEFELPAADFPAERVGVNFRRFLDHRFNAYDMAVVAAREALRKAELPLERYRVVLVSTITPPYTIPPLAAMLQAELNLSTELVAFDSPMGCNGYLGGLHLMRALLRDQPEGSAGLLITSEVMTRVIDATDRQTSVIFGDAAAATVLVSGAAQPGLAEVSWSTQGEKGSHLIIQPGPPPAYRFHVDEDGLSLKPDLHSSSRLVMQGRQVFKDMVTDLPKRIAHELESRGRQLSDYAAVAFHQANLRIVDAVASRLQLPADKMLSNLAELGNTSSASVPLMLSQARLKPGERALLVGFGTGYSVGVTELVWQAGPKPPVEFSSVLPGSQPVPGRMSQG